MSNEKVMRAFQFHVIDEPESIYPFSPVYKVKQDGKSYIVKRTQRPMARAKSVVKFIQHLKQYGVSVVTPVSLSVENPQQIDDVVWIVYPYIDGTTYTGKSQEVYEAGKLLGKIHSLSSMDNQYHLDNYDEFDFDMDEITKDVATIKQYAETRGIPVDDENLRDRLIGIMEKQETLEKLELPSVATPYDFKANNLIYNDQSKPFLVDPDNATFLPRLYDLALTLLLFHNELTTAPARIFDVEEWGVFKQGYFEYVRLTDIEKTYWQDIVKHVYMDEVIWMMAEFEEDWDDSNQLGLLKTLLGFLDIVHKYNLEG
ncbi:aminoglycoside phosphotransferase family protein [Lentibacillus sp. N15]|uniref:aminoglycoside phosphotransferase family protein n=1 Tax=Lentibacillus songyuanensis TaxID=3136161 RepID=UPI0031BB87CF